MKSLYYSMTFLMRRFVLIYQTSGEKVCVCVCVHVFSLPLTLPRVLVAPLVFKG